MLVGLYSYYLAGIPSKYWYYKYDKRVLYPPAQSPGILSFCFEPAEPWKRASKKKGAACCLAAAGCLTSRSSLGVLACTLESGRLAGKCLFSSDRHAPLENCDEGRPAGAACYAARATGLRGEEGRESLVSSL